MKEMNESMDPQTTPRSELPATPEVQDISAAEAEANLRKQVLEEQRIQRLLANQTHITSML